MNRTILFASNTALLDVMVYCSQSPPMRGGTGDTAFSGPSQGDKPWEFCIFLQPLPLHFCSRLIIVVIVTAVFAYYHFEIPF